MVYRGLFGEILVQFPKLVHEIFDMKSTRTKLLLLLITAALAILPVSTPASEVAEDRGAMGLSQALKRLDVVASVLHTGAHPDDEDSALLPWLPRGHGVRTAYLSATRRRGGVDLVGSELFDTLAVVLTEGPMTA